MSCQAPGRTTPGALHDVILELAVGVHRRRLADDADLASPGGDHVVALDVSPERHLRGVGDPRERADRTRHDHVGEAVVGAGVRSQPGPATDG